MNWLLCFFGIHNYAELGPTKYYIDGNPGLLSWGVISRCTRCHRARYRFLHSCGGDADE